MITLEYLGRDLDIWYNFYPGEVGVGLNPSVQIWKVEYLGRRIDGLLSWNTIDDLEWMIWDDIN